MRLQHLRPHVAEHQLVTAGRVGQTPLLASPPTDDGRVAKAPPGYVVSALRKEAHEPGIITDKFIHR